MSRIVVATFWAGYASGLTVEKAFVLGGWPDTTAVPMFVAGAIGLLLIGWAATHE